MSATRAKSAIPDVTSAPHEDVLRVTNIQGIVVPGFFKPAQMLIAISLPTSRAGIANVKAFLRTFADEVATAATTLRDRREHRERVAFLRKQEVAKTINAPTTQPPEKTQPVLVALAFTYAGLLKLTPSAEAIPGDAFRLGLASRSSLLGDPIDPSAEGHPNQWKIGGPGNEPDALFIIAGDMQPDVERRAAEVRGRLDKLGIDVVFSEQGGVRADMPGHEHFGFSDGVSQPGIRGRASEDPNDFITDRHIAAERVPECYLYGYPGQDLLWPGAFVLGLPAPSPDPLVPGLITPAVPDWTRHGSFLVFRRLRQDVGLFWRTMRDTAAQLVTKPGFETTTDETLAARLFGRWPSGAPVNRVPAADDAALGADPRANNHIRFDSDAAKLPLDQGHDDPFPMAKADPAGITCPWAAHIRKVNTRDAGSDVGGRESTFTRRLLRVGVAFGQSLADRYADRSADPQKGERGLLFLSIQASIEDQFEFLMSRWMGDPSRPKMPGGHDVVVGQNGSPGEARMRRCVLFGSGLQQAAIQTDAQWIVPTGGGYFFVPSIDAIRNVLGT